MNLHSPAHLAGVKEGDIIAGIGVSKRDVHEILPGDTVDDVSQIVRRIIGRSVVMWLERPLSLRDKLKARKRTEEAAQEERKRHQDALFRVPGDVHPRWGILVDRR